MQKEEEEEKSQWPCARCHKGIYTKGIGCSVEGCSRCYEQIKIMMTGPVAERLKEMSSEDQKEEIMKMLKNKNLFRDPRFVDLNNML